MILSRPRRAEIVVRSRDSADERHLPVRTGWKIMAMVIMVMMTVMTMMRMARREKDDNDRAIQMPPLAMMVE